METGPRYRCRAVLLRMKESGRFAAESARRSGSWPTSHGTTRSTPCAAMRSGLTCSASMQGHGSYERTAADTMFANECGELRRAVPAGRTVSEARELPAVAL